MKLYTLRQEQKLPMTLEQAWDFFSDPRNLNTITPDDMKFETLSGDDKKMYVGQIIHYKISPFPFITMQWVTEIAHMEEGKYFVDEQRFGPYAFWHHKHFFKAIEGGILMEDIIHYKLPLGLLGQLAHPFLVKRKLQEIFRFRKEKLTTLFGTYHEK